MPEDSRFFDSRDHSEGEFAEVLADLSTEGVYQHADQKLKVLAPGGRLVNVSAGRAIVQGFWYRLTALQGMAISENPAGLIRYDRVVLRLDRPSNRVILAIREGIPGSGVPALARAIGGSWEISLASVRVGPGVTNIADVDVADERGYASVCGWAGGRGALGPENVDGLTNFIAISPLDTDTGFQWPTANRIDIVAGAKPVATFSATGNSIGAFDMSTVIRGGGTVGAPQERIYVDSDYILIGRELGAGTGVPTIQIGTAVRTSAITIGHYTTAAMYATIYMHGIPVHMLPPVNNLIHYNITDGYYTGLNLQNTTATKKFTMLLATGGAAGLGSAGDASIYTGGTAAGRLMLGTQDTARLHLSSSYMAFGVQGARSGGFSFQQATNDAAGGIRQYHTNGSHNLQWYNDVSGRHVWGINDVPQMWLFTNGVLTVGGTGAKGSGFNFTQVANSSAWGLRVYHTNQSYQADIWIDDASRVVFGVNDVASMWFYGGVFTCGGPTPRAAGFNYQQTANSVGYGYRLWHTDQVTHSDLVVDANGRLVLSNQDTARIHIHPNGTITFGTAATDQAALTITATFGDTEASGIRLNNAGGSARWWCRSDGMNILGSASTQVWFHHAFNALTPSTNNAMNLGYPNYAGYPGNPSFRWANVYSYAGDFAGNVTIAGNLNVTGTIAIGGGSPTFADITVNGTAHITNLSGAGTYGPVYPTGNGQVQLGANGRAWADIFGTTYWKPGGGNGFNDTNCDDRLKYPDSFRPYDRGLGVVMRLEPVYYTTTGEYYSQKDVEFVGFRTSALVDVAPEMVGTHMVPRTPDDEEEELMYLDTTRLQYMLVNAIQEQQAQIDALRADIAALQKGAA